MHYFVIYLRLHSFQFFCENPVAIKLMFCTKLELITYKRISKAKVQVPPDESSFRASYYKCFRNYGLCFVFGVSRVRVLNS